MKIVSYGSYIALRSSKRKSVSKYIDIDVKQGCENICIRLPLL